MVSPCFYFSQIIPSGKVTYPIILTTVWTTVWSCLLKPELRSRTNMFIRSLKEGTKSGDHWTKIRGQNQKPAPGLVASATYSIENYLCSMRKFHGFSKSNTKSDQTESVDMQLDSYIYRLLSISKHCPSICEISSHWAAPTFVALLLWKKNAARKF